MKQTNKTARLATAGVMTALAFILSYLESLLPAFTGVPGIKPGLANIATMTAMYVLGWPAAAGIAAVRVILAGLIFNGMSAMLYGLAGTCFSLAGMLLLKRTGCFSTTAVSVAGGVLHNIGQILVAVCVLGSAVMYYLPALLISGLAAGFIVGIIASLIIPRI